MSRMIRKQVYIEPEQAELLKQRAKELGIREADLIRRCIDQLAQGSATLPLDSKAWQEEIAYIRERARLQEALGKQRGWTREELYEQRLQRFSR
jgi:Ribbon-helix-helix domain